MPLLYRVERADLQGISLRIEELGSRRILYRDTLKSLAQPADQEWLAFLIPLHLRSSVAARSADPSFQCVEIKAEMALEALRLLAKTGRAQWKNRPLQFVPTPMKMMWKGDKRELRGWLGEIPLEEWECVTPTWCMREGIVYPFAKSVSWKWIERFLKGAVCLEGGEKKRFLEEEPQVVWKEPPVEQVLEVLPQLELSDRTGCFANLWMEYRGVGRIAFEDLAPTVGGKGRLKGRETEWEKDLLETGFMRKVVGQSRYYCPGDRVKEALVFLLDLGWTLFDDQKRLIVKQKKCNWNVREKEGCLLVEGKIEFQGGIEASLKKGVQGRGMWIDLEGNRVGLLDRKEFEGFEGEWEEEGLIMPRSAVGTLVQKEGGTWEASLASLAQRLQQGLQNGAKMDLTPPGPSFQGTLLPYQQKGLDWLAFLYRFGFSALLADEMGLGKTVQVLAFFSQLRTNLPLLVVAPNSLLFQWKKEIERFLPGASVLVHSGPDRAKTIDFEGIVITSYAILRLDEEIFAKGSFEVVVLDESNAIKTASTQTAQAAFRLQARFRIALTGTPIENRAEELVSQFKFLIPGLLKEKAPLEKEKIRPFILKRKKSDVAIELPEKIEQISWIEMEEAQETVYDAYLSAFKNGLLKKIEQEGIGAHRMEVLEVILRLRQICSDPRLVGETVEGAKMERLCEEIEGTKALVFSSFTSMLHLIERRLMERNIPYLVLEGSTSLEEREKRVAAFQNSKEPVVFLLSLKAGGVGLNLTEADTVFLFDPWWNEAVENQAIDRAHRIGQKKSVLVKRYLIPNTIEEKMLRLKEKKRELAEAFLDDTSSWKEEDLLHLLI